MYDVEKTDWRRLLVGRSLEQVCFARYQVNLHLTGGLDLRITCPFRHTPPGKSEEFPLASSDLMSLLEQKVTEATASQRVLTLVFEGGGRVDFFESEHFESLQVHVGQVEINV